MKNLYAKNHHSLLFFLAFFTVGNSEAQNYDWGKKTIIPNGIVINKLLNDDVENIYLVGSASNDYSHADTIGSFISKLNSNGTLLFSKQWKESFFINSSYSYQNNIYVTGFFNGNIVIDGMALSSNGNTDGFVGEVNSSGTFNWIKTFGTLNYEEGKDLTIDSANNSILVTGGVHDQVNSGNGTSKIFIKSFQIGGTLNWNKDLDYYSGFSYGGNSGYEINLDNDGNICLLAYRAGNHPLDGPAPLPGCVLIKLDSSLDSLWTYNFSKSCYYSNEKISNLKIDNSKVLVTSYCGDRVGSYGMIYEFNNSGVKNNSFSNQSRDYRGICIVPSSNIFMIGNEGSTLCMCESNDYGYEVIKKVDENYNTVWEEKFNSAGFNQINSIANSVFVFGGFYMDTLIFNEDTLLNNTNYDQHFVVKISDNSIANSISDKPVLPTLNIYPNPSMGIFNVNLNDKSGEAEICVYDILGNCILKGVSVKNKAEVNLSSLSKGVYFMDVSTNDGKETRKVVLQ